MPRLGNGRLINNIRYADDTALIARSQEELQELINRVEMVGETYGIRINVKKTKFMVVSRTEQQTACLSVGMEPIERVPVFKYLGCRLLENTEVDTEIKTRIAVAKASFMKYKAVLCDKHLSIPARLRFLQCYVWSVFLYGVEAWILKASHLNRIEAFEMWCYRRMQRISWVRRMTNENVLQLMNTDRKLLTIVRRRKVSYVGHLLCGEKYSLLLLVFEGKIEGNRSIGRRKTSWYSNILQWTGLKYHDLKNKALNRDEFRQIVANL
ncbi:hypothetical protein GE061_006708 [Apolygus lucorum]|uniref:Reverse transcriptase domain-containing protein n=1 Tax=Apolygus lucorum TaxID=248454 RepID=A0A8S9WYI4_APOLU|nr:hypothetical protein GE061_006708 [Apolygus lucorum]